MGEMKISFSVVIPAYNCENTIERTLDSVKKQTRLDLISEVIIINDGSIDDTELIIKEYIKKNNKMEIRYIRQENKGVSYARNKGIRMAKGTWIALLDSDDEWSLRKIEVQYNILSNNSDIKFLGSAYPLRFLLIKKNGLYKVNPFELCIRSTPMTPTVVFEKETGMKFGLFDENRKFSEDIQFFQKFLLIDSYYVIVDNLVNVSIGKSYFGQKGLSSHFKEMHIGRNDNVKELYEMKLINWWFMKLILLFNQLKYFRRCLLQKVYYIKDMRKYNEKK